jgi:hypothetical protein
LDHIENSGVTFAATSDSGVSLIARGLRSVIHLGVYAVKAIVASPISTENRIMRTFFAVPEFYPEPKLMEEAPKRA